MTARRWTRIVLCLGVAVAVYALVQDSHAQAVGDGPTSVVMTSPQQGNGWGTIGDLSWPAAAYAVVNRFLTVLERMVTDTRAWLDRALDLTKGRIRLDHRKTIINYTDTGQGPEDITGPIPRLRRRTDDPGRNGSHDDDQ